MIERLLHRINVDPADSLSEIEWLLAKDPPGGLVVIVHSLSKVEHAFVITPEGTRPALFWKTFCYWQDSQAERYSRRKYEYRYGRSNKS